MHMKKSKLFQGRSFQLEDRKTQTMRKFLSVNKIGWYVSHENTTVLNEIHTNIHSYPL